MDEVYASRRSIITMRYLRCPFHPVWALSTSQSGTISLAVISFDRTRHTRWNLTYVKFQPGICCMCRLTSGSLMHPCTHAEPAKLKATLNRLLYMLCCGTVEVDLKRYQQPEGDFLSPERRNVCLCTQDDTRCCRCHRSLHVHCWYRTWGWLALSPLLGIGLYDRRPPTSSCRPPTVDMSVVCCTCSLWSWSKMGCWRCSRGGRCHVGALPPAPHTACSQEGGQGEPD